MKPVKCLGIISAALLAAIFVGTGWLIKNQPVPQKMVMANPPPVALVKPAETVPPPDGSFPTSKPTPADVVQKPAAPEKLSAVKPVKQNSSAQSKVPIQDPAARTALSFVGANHDAETYWLSAINDPGLSADERKDLIEDLNEDGLSDPKHPSAEDWPLIWNRISLIEELAPSAMDQVNADAFAEAYKDLVNLALGNGAQ